MLDDTGTPKLFRSTVTCTPSRADSCLGFKVRVCLVLWVVRDEGGIGSSDHCTSHTARPQLCCRANVAHIRQSGPHSGLGLHIKDLGTFQGVMCSLESGGREREVFDHGVTGVPRP